MPSSPLRACRKPGCPGRTDSAFCDTCNQSRCKTTIVAGPPGSGKTTYVRNHMNIGDLVVDLDEIFRAITLDDSRDHSQALLPFAAAARDAIINRLDSEHDVKQAWIIGCLPKLEERRFLAQRLNATVLVLEVKFDLCMSRISQDNRVGAVDWPRLIKTWWSQYEFGRGEQRIAGQST